MIPNGKLLPAVMLSGMIVLSGGCTLNKMVKLAKKQELTVTPNPLEVHADQVKFNMTATLPVKMLKKKTTYTGNVGYKYGDKRDDVGQVVFNAADYPNAKKEQPKITKDFSFAYQDAMRKGELVMQGTAAKGKKSKTTPEVTVAPGIITTSRLYKEPNLVAYAETGYTTEPEYEPTNVAFFFPQGSAQLQTSETRSKRGKFFDNFIAEKNVTKTVTITGTHSPEGAERVNSKLSENRAEAIQKYYRNKMKVYNYKNAADSVEFVLKPVIQDWAQLKDTLATTTLLTEEQKTEVLGIIDAGGEFEEQEDQLHRLSYYRTLLNQVYPKLRTAQTEILTLIPKKPDSELSVLARQMAEGRADSANMLNEKEILHAATLTPDLEEKAGIYQAAMKQFGEESWKPHNDYAAVQLEMAKKANDPAKKTQLADEALNHLQMAVKLQETAEVYNNMAVAYTMKGDREQAMQALTKAAGMTGGEQVTKMINAAKGVQQIRAAQYSEAVSTLSQAGDTSVVLYNRGLAQILADQADAAMTTLTEATSKDANDGDAFYLMAIAAARAKNEQAVMTNLQQAIQKNADLRARAIDDLEFRAYTTSEAFKNAIR